MVLELSFQLIATEDDSFLGRLVQVQLSESGSLTAAWIDGDGVPPAAFRWLEKMIGGNYLSRKAIAFEAAQESKDELAISKSQAEDKMMLEGA